MKKGSESERKYFSDVSAGYSKAAKILFIVMAVYFLITLFFNSKLLTYNNFSYLLRDLNSAADLASGNYSSISYNDDELRVTKSFRGGIITVSSTDLAIYTATGNKTLYVNDSFVSPNVATSKKYAVVYELGGKKYSVYNSFARISTGSFQYPISGASASDSGWFALTTKDRTHNSVVYLYDDDCRHRNTYSFATKYVFATAISGRGHRIAIVLTEPDGEKFSTSVMICEPGKSEKRAEVKISDGLPYGCTFTSEGNIQVICSDGAYLLDGNDGSMLNSYALKGINISRVSITPEGTAVAASGNLGVASNRIFVFDKKGNMIFETTVEGGMLDMEYGNGYVFVNQSTEVFKINVKNGEKTRKSTSYDGSDVIIYDGGNILLCCPTKAVYIKF